MYISSHPKNKDFDYIIVGAGSSGCVMADRLDAGRRHRVLLVEAGGRDNKSLVEYQRGRTRNWQEGSRHGARAGARLNNRVGEFHD